eukprot:TRINITY_DN13559_c0_g1_i1.p1 TRINITY_DN13559_c0_g1~~TRINITY_DN13559_c0_g1_i1.p1  ORF type:complete len:558 (+),score=94.23 TRINITY_DN13559_c0_g1_i1:116-1789(+)
MRGMAAVPSACASSLVAVIAAVFVILLQGCADFEQIEQAVTGDSNATAALPSPTPSLSPTPTPLSSTSPIPTSSSAQSPTTTTSQVSKAISLSLIHWGGGPRLVVDLAPAARRPAGSDGSSSSSSSSSSSWLASQKFVLDTGSSTLAFCSNGNTLMNQAAYSLTNYISCNKYNPGGQSTGYWGPFVHGLLRMGAGTSITLEAEYSIMAEEVAMPCTDGINGIFGIAFRQLDVAFWSGDRPQWGAGTVGSCPTQTAGNIMPPLLRKLQSEGGSEKVGIFWSGRTGVDEGALFFDDAATANPHYLAAPALGPAALGEVGWYDIRVARISVGQTVFTEITCNPYKAGQNCILDTGTPSIVVPQRIYDQLQEAIALDSMSLLTFWLSSASAEEEAVPVSFDVAALLKLGGISATAKGDGLILGLPLWAFYYTLFDISEQSVSFVPQKAAPTITRAPSTSTWAPQTELPPLSPQPFPGPSSQWQPIPRSWPPLQWQPSNSVIPSPWGGILKDNITLANTSSWDGSTQNESTSNWTTKHLRTGSSGVPFSSGRQLAVRRALMV